ncbi:rod shape-determining protein RodA [Treponema pectinovorum]|uniref:rod shape-determining protein RodA n=1 Tax=Treponema pectinovorum TaxID=164 RepID=UPI003D8BB106
MKTKIYQAFDYFLLFCVLVLVCLGIMFIYSSGINSEGVNVSNEYIKQIIWAGIGFALMLFIAVSDYRRLDRYVAYLYVFCAAILIYTKLFGRYVNGARSWIGFGGFGIQPSEFCKILYILFLAWYLERYKNEDPLKRFLFAFAIFLLPTALILLQPDLGTAMVYIPIFLLMCFVAGFPLRYIALVFLCGMLTVIFAVLPIYQSEIAHVSYTAINILTSSKLRLLVIIASASICFIGIFGKIFLPENKYFYWIAYFFGIVCVALIFSKLAGSVLKDYQIKRLIVFIDPDSDPRGSGWNIIQSKIAIGSGNFLGQGFLRGTQSHYRFLPEQSTDFIFSILAEEFGFFGGILVFLLYFGLLIRIVYIMRGTNNEFGYYICAGILAMFFFHFIVNVGMVMGIMPITGIPLLFLSYGGSSLWTALFCVGLVMSVNSHKFEL